MSRNSFLKKVPLRTWLVPVFTLILIGAAVALGVFHPSEFGHSGQDEIFFDTQVISNSCAGKFCNAVCPINYRVTGGGCGAASPRVTQLNLVSSSGSQNSWDCFDSAWVSGASNVIATATCMRVGNPSVTPYEFCGNYTIETAAPPGNLTETCDMNNTGALDCSDFFTSGGQQLCNGNLACASSCTAYNASSCDYCQISNCPPGYQYCSDHSCQLSCDGLDSGVPVGGVGNGCQPGVPCSTITPTPPAIPAYCGNGLYDLGEECDGDGSVCPGDPTFHCPNGATDTSSAPTCAANCTCQNHNSCSFSTCGNGTLDAGEACEGGDASTCPVQTGGLTVCSNCNCVFIPEGQGDNPPVAGLPAGGGN